MNKTAIDNIVILLTKWAANPEVNPFTGKRVVDSQAVWDKLSRLLITNLNHVTLYVNWGRIEVGEMCGQGTFGRVYKLKGALAGHVMKVEPIASDGLKKEIAFYKEIERTRHWAKEFGMKRLPFLRLIKSGIAKCLDIEFRYIILEEQEASLDKMLLDSPTGTLSLHSTIRIMRDILDGVFFLNHIGIVHQDVFLKNIILDANNNAYLIDFGISDRMSEDTDVFGDIMTWLHSFILTLTGSLPWQDESLGLGESHLVRLAFERDWRRVLEKSYELEIPSVINRLADIIMPLVGRELQPSSVIKLHRQLVRILEEYLERDEICAKNYQGKKLDVL